MNNDVGEKGLWDWTGQMCRPSVATVIVRMTGDLWRRLSVATGGCHGDPINV